VLRSMRDELVAALGGASCTAARDFLPSSESENFQTAIGEFHTGADTLAIDHQLLPPDAILHNPEGYVPLSVNVEACHICWPQSHFLPPRAVCSQAQRQERPNQRHFRAIPCDW
jgi:hypothetical protein